MSKTSKHVKNKNKFRNWGEKQKHFPVQVWPVFKGSENKIEKVDEIFVIFEFSFELNKNVLF